jgi:hypothetical protein
LRYFRLRDTNLLRAKPVLYTRRSRPQCVSLAPRLRNLHIHEGGPKGNDCFLLARQVNNPVQGGLNLIHALGKFLGVHAGYDFAATHHLSFHSLHFGYAATDLKRYVNFRGFNSARSAKDILLRSIS